MKSPKRGRPRRTRQQILEDVFWAVIQAKYLAGQRYKLGVRWHQDNIPDLLRRAERRKKSHPLSESELRAYSGTISAMINHKQMFVREHLPHGNRLLVPAVYHGDVARSPRTVEFKAAWERK